MPRFLAAACLLLMLSNCAPAPSLPPAFHALNPRPAVAQVLPEATEAPAAPADVDPDAPARTTPDEAKITFEGVAFDSRSHHLVLVDQAQGPGSQFADAAAAAASRDGLAAINGGFFTPEGEPLGLVVAAGKASGQWNAASSLGSGLFHESPSGAMRISRRETITPEKALEMRELLQAGPMLVDQHQTVSGLEASKFSERSVLLWDGQYRWWFGRSSKCSLQQLAAAISRNGPVGWRTEAALNLDGGSSSELWISKAIVGGPATRSGWWKKPARNYLVLVER